LGKLRWQELALVKDGADYHIRHYKQHILTYRKPVQEDGKTVHRVEIYPYGSISTYAVLWYVGRIGTRMRLEATDGTYVFMVMSGSNLVHTYVDGRLDKSRSTNGVWYRQTSSDRVRAQRQAARDRFDPYIQLALLAAEPDVTTAARSTWQYSVAVQTCIGTVRATVRDVQSYLDRDEEAPNEWAELLMTGMRKFAALQLGVEKTRSEVLSELRRIVSDCEVARGDLKLVGEEWPEELPQRVMTWAGSREKFRARGDVVQS
jgi:hypothetical protein